MKKEIIPGYYVDIYGLLFSPKGEMKGTYDKNGYRVYRMPKILNRKLIKGHRLVAQAFIPNPDNLEQVNHKNGIKDDNRVENLEWCTSKENVQHSFDVLKRISPKGKNHIKSVPEVDNSTGIIYESKNLASTATGIPHCTIRWQCKNINKPRRWSLYHQST